MSLEEKSVLLNGASMGIGEAIAKSLAAEGVNLVLVSRTESKLAALSKNLRSSNPSQRFIYCAVDVGDFDAADTAVASVVDEAGRIDVLINNAGAALGTPATYPNLKISDISTMANANINGMMWVIHSFLNRSMRAQKPERGAILNVTSVTGLEVPPFPGEAAYHASKAFQEAFTNAIRNELGGTDIRVLVLRPGCVATNFHSQRVGHDNQMYDSFFEGYDPLISDDIAQAAVYMLKQPLNISIKALDAVPSAQRSLNVFDRMWKERQR